MQDFKLDYGTVEKYLKRHPNKEGGFVADIPYAMDVIYEKTDDPNVMICHVKFPVNKDIFN